MDDAHELRKLAEWYRSFAEVGHSANRVERLRFAEYLKRRAEEVAEKPKRAADDT